MEINIGVVIVTYNNEKDIEGCLNSLVNQTFKDFKIIVVDNNSSDKTKEIIISNFPEVTLLAQNENLYLTGGNNLGIKYCFDNFNSEFILVLNPDTVLEKDLIQNLLSVIQKDPSIGAVGPKVKFLGGIDDGKINSAGLFFDGFDQAYDIGFKEDDKGQYNSEKKVFGVTGACILYRSEMLKNIGSYWTRIKLYLDEVELFTRAQKRGWKVLYVPSAVVHHKYMVSTSQEKLEKIDKLKKEAWLWIALRHYPLKSKLAMIYKYFLN